jgi:quinol monooxygenase YgiN
MTFTQTCAVVRRLISYAVVFAITAYQKVVDVSVNRRLGYRLLLRQVYMRFTYTETHGEAEMSNDTQSPGPNPPNHTQVEVHPGWVRSGRDDTPGRKAYYINLEAKPGKGDKVEQFLRDILAGVEQEPGTGPWFGCRFSDTTFGIFEAFPDTAARNAHDIGPGGRNFLRSAELDEMLAYPAHLYRLDVMFGKFSVMFGKKITSE